MNKKQKLNQNNIKQSKIKTLQKHNKNKTNIKNIAITKNTETQKRKHYNNRTTTNSNKVKQTKNNDNKKA